MKIIKPSHLQICKKYYSLHYIHTRNLFIFSFIISITNQFMGDAVIFCNTAHESSIPEAMINSFCYLNGTYTDFNGKQYYHHYYKWISIILLLEVFTFYIPFFVWGNKCRAYIESIVFDKNENPLELNETRCKYILKEIKNSNFNIYVKHLILEIVFFVNVILQFTLLHALLNFKYFTFEFDLLFPYNAKCDIHGVGVGGNLSKLKILCNLPLNILYKKIFIVIYVWFWCLIISNLFYIFIDTYNMIKQKKTLTCNQWLLYKIVKWNVAGEDKKYIIEHII